MRPLSKLLLLLLALCCLGGTWIASPGKGSHAAAGGGPITEVQTKQYASTGNSSTHTLTWTSTPTNGNLLVITVNSAATMTAPSGWTIDVSAVDFVGTYIISKISNGTESSVVVTIGSSTSCAMSAFEYSGITTGIDKTASATFQGAGPNAIGTGTTATTATANELLVAVAGSNQTARTVTSWDNSFVQLGTKTNTTGSGAGSDVWNLSSRKTVSATGAYTTAANLDSASAGHDNGCIATYK